MNTGSTDAAERLRFRERYRNLSDDDLTHLAADENLVPAARQATAEEVNARGLRDQVSSLRRQRTEETRALQKEQKHGRWLGFTILVLFGMLGVHKWLLGDATTWRKEEALALWLFFVLVFTWDPTIHFLKGRAPRRFAFWLVLAWLYFATVIAIFAVPALGRIVSDSNPVLALAILASPGVVAGVHRIVEHYACR